MTQPACQTQEFAKFVERMKAVADTAEARTEAKAASVTEKANLLRWKAMATTEASDLTLNVPS